MSDGSTNPLEGFSLDAFSAFDSAPSFEERDDDFGKIDNSDDDSNNDDSNDDNLNNPPSGPNVIRDEEDEAEIDDTDTDEDFNFIEALAQEGIIELDENESIEGKDLEWFSEKAKQKLQKDLNEAIDDYKSTLPDEIKELLDNYESGVPIGKLLQAEKSVFEISKINIDDLEDNEKLQKQVITNYLKSQGESDDDIKDTLNDYEDAGLLKKQALRVHPKMVAAEVEKKNSLIQQEKARAINEKENYNKWLVDIKKTIDDKKEIIPGIELTDKQRKDLYAGITKVDKDGLNEIAKFRKQNPDFDLQVAYIATVLKGDFSKFESSATTKAVKQIKAQADNLNSTSGKATSKLRGVDLSIMKKAIKF